MCIQRLDHTRLIITRDTNFHGSSMFTRQIDNTLVFQCAHAVTYTFCTDLLDSFLHMFGGSPLTRMDGHMQTRLLGFLEDTIKKIRWKLSFITCKVQSHHAIFEMLDRQPGNLFRPVRSLMTIDGCDQ